MGDMAADLLRGSTSFEDEEEELQEREKRASLAELWDQENLEFVLADPKGRAVIHRILSKCGVFTASFQGENTHTTAWLEGRRSIGSEILLDVLTVQRNVDILMRNEDEDRQRQIGARYD